MPETITQANRLLALTTPAGEDVLLLNSFTGQEAISRPFRFVLDMVADVQNGNPAKVKPHDLVGKQFTIRIQLEDNEERYISGYCERFSAGAQDDDFAYYSAAIVPWFSFLSLASNCRMFQNMTVPDIIQQVVSSYDYSSSFKNQLTKTYTAWD
ncbi:MAG: contractile injection system protein, VgrG/Pvc8 family, partial [Bryobacteraceae bacterium]